MSDRKSKKSDSSHVDEDGTSHTINTGRWTREEHNMFLHGLETYGKEWKKIADLIKTRSVVQIRTHAQKYFQKVAKHTGQPVMSTSKKEAVVRPPTRKRKTDEEKFKKPGSITVPPFGSRKENGGHEKRDGSATPRTVAAATILLRPRIQHKLETGGATPKTRETAAWLDGHSETALEVLEKRRKRKTHHSPRMKLGNLSWDTAAATTVGTRKRR
mmetsp:Transcript_9353/g.11210  ORF Transcript_9353/g.11210 Transcript_9353/m.11210 type:complete len:215 (+) Transcript_9353:454-1098(+)